jgi:hypothetical protein
MGQQDHILCMSAMAMHPPACLFSTKIELEPNGCIIGANRRPQCKSRSETTKQTRISDQRGVMSPTR